MILDPRDLNIPHHFVGEVIRPRVKFSPVTQQSDGRIKISVLISSSVVILLYQVDEKG